METTARIYLDFVLQYPRIHIYDNLLGWKLKKSIIIRRKTRQFDYSTSTNSHGLRSDEIPLEKSHHVYRILILGDSMAFGEGVELEERFDQQLKKLAIAGKTIEVINAGVMGYGTDQEFLYLASQGLKFKPDLVILMTHENDIEDIMLDYNNTRRKPRFIIKDGDLNITGLPIPFTSKIRDYSLVYTFFYTGLMKVIYRKPMLDLEDGLRLFLKLREKIYILCQRNNINLVNVIFSSLKSLEERNTIWKRPILESSSSQSVSTIDLDPLFLDQENIKSLFLNQNIHWNREGSRIVGEFLLEKVTEILRDQVH